MSETKKTIARNNLERFRRAKAAGHDDYVKIADTADKFYKGEQWNDADKAQLDSEGRPALTLNMVLSTINTILGEQMERKIDITFKASRGGVENTALALNAITRAILDDNKFDEVDEEVFSDGVIGGRGFFDIRMSFMDNLQGDVVISAEDGVDIIIDPEAKSADPRKWNEVFVSRWMTPDQIEEEYGHKSFDLISLSAQESNGTGANDVFEYERSTFGDNVDDYVDDAERGALKRVRVIERQHYRLAKQLHYVDLETGDLRAVPFGTDDNEAKALAEEYGLGLQEMKRRRVRMTVSVGEILLNDDWSIYRSFTIGSFFPYFRRGNPFGVVENLFDPQNLLNKTSSQELHIVNTTANSGWITQEDSLVDMDNEDLEERGAETGLVLSYKRGYEKPEKIQPNQIPTGIDRISQKAAVTIRDISAVNSSMLGTSRADQSGRAQENQVARGQIAMNVVLANHRKAHRRVVEKVLELVQDFYDETRYFKMVDDTMFGDPEESQVAINEVGDDGNILNDVTIGKYSVDVGYIPAGGTAHDVEFNEAKGLRELGIAIPDHFMVQYSNLTKKTQLTSFLRDSQGFGEQTEEQAELESFQMQHQIAMLQREQEEKDADIELKMANARSAMAKADSLEDYNQAQMEMLKLNQQRDMHEQDIRLRIALAARSHQSQGTQNDKRITSQVAMKAMDIAGNQEKNKSQQQDKKGKAA